MIALLRNIRNLKQRIKKLKKGKKGIKDLERKKRIDEKIALLESLLDTHIKLTTDFVNNLPDDLKEAAEQYFYEVEEWGSIEEKITHGIVSKDYLRIYIERFCNSWDTK